MPRNYYIYGNELAHHGVKGMKWGRRKAKKAKTSKRKSKRERLSANSTMSAAKARENELRSRVNSIFKKHPDLYDDFGGPDQIDDFELLDLIMMERGYD